MANVNGFFSRIKLCVMERSFGKTVVLETLGTAIKYFLFFILIIGSITMIEYAYDFKVAFEEVTQHIKEAAPEFRFENGYLECQGDMPLIEEDGNIIFAIDTTGKINQDILNSYDEGILITSTKLIQKRNSSEYRTINFSDMDWLNFTKRDMIKFVNKWSLPVSIVIFIIGLILIFIDKIINVVIISIIGLFINAIMKSKLLYENIFKLSVYAITLPTIVNMITNLFNITIPYFFVIYYGLTIYYLYRYLSEIKKESELNSTIDTDEAILHNVE